MSRKAENWLLVEWTGGGQNVVYVKSVLSPDNKELKVGEAMTVNWQGEPKSAVLKERSCNREELEAKSKANQAGPSSEAGSNDEGEGFSASGSSWAPSDDGALSNDSFNEKPAKKVKIEKTKRQYVNRRTSKKVIIPSHRANAVIPKIMQNQGANSKKNESGRKRTHNEPARNNSFNKTVPDSTIVQQNNKGNNNKRCSLNMKELQEISDTFRSLFQMIGELKKPYQNTTPNISNPNITKRFYQNPTSNLNMSNPNIGRKLYQNTSNLNISNSNVGRKLYQNTTNLNTSYPNMGKKLYQNTSNPNTSYPSTGKKLYQNAAKLNTSYPNIGKKLYQNTLNPNVSNPNIGKISYQITPNSVNNSKISNSCEIPIVYQELVVEAIDPTEEGEEIAEYENEEFNRSDDNVLITNKYDNKQYSRKPSEDNKQYIRKPTEDNKQYNRKPTEDKKQYTQKPTEDKKQYTQKLTEDKKQCTQKPPEDNKQYTQKPTAGPSKDDEWVAIGSGKTLIHADQFRKVNWRSYTVATRTLLLAVFPRRVLATHSLTGKKSPAFQDKPAKMCLDPKIISDVIMEIQDRFDVKENLIRSIITTKCADEAKMLKMRKNRNAAINGNRENEPPNVKFEEDKKGNV